MNPFYSSLAQRGVDCLLNIYHAVSGPEGDAPLGELRSLVWRRWLPVTEAFRRRQLRLIDGVLVNLQTVVVLGKYLFYSKELEGWLLVDGLWQSCVLHLTLLLQSLRKASRCVHDIAQRWLIRPCYLIRLLLCRIQVHQRCPGRSLLALRSGVQPERRHHCLSEQFILSPRHTTGTTVLLIPVRQRPILLRPAWQRQNSLGMLLLSETSSGLV